jgi:hypothetical protein
MSIYFTNLVDATSCVSPAIAYDGIQRGHWAVTANVSLQFFWPVACTLTVYSVHGTWQ